MPKTTFAPENKVIRGESFPKLKLEKGEYARIVCIEQEPITEFVHTLRAPQIVNGEVAYEMRPGKDGQQVREMKYDFIGRPICLGDVGVLQDNGVDPDNCPICKASLSEDSVRPPEQRYAMHIMRYSTKPGGFDLASPFAVHTLVWAFSDFVFNKLIDIHTEWGDLRKHDLLLGPCTVAMYQKFEIAVAAKAAWLESAEAKALTVETYKGNQSSDLSSYCGRRSDRGQVMMDLERVLERNRVAFGGSAPAAGGELPDLGERQAVTQELSALLDDGPEVPPESAAPEPLPAQDSEPTLAVLDSLDEDLQDVPAAQPAPSTAPSSSGETVDFDELLGDL